MRIQLSRPWLPSILNSHTTQRTNCPDISTIAANRRLLDNFLQNPSLGPHHKAAVDQALRAITEPDKPLMESIAVRFLENLDSGYDLAEIISCLHRHTKPKAWENVANQVLGVTHQGMKRPTHGDLISSISKIRSKMQPSQQTEIFSLTHNLVGTSTDSQMKQCLYRTFADLTPKHLEAFISFVNQETQDMTPEAKASTFINLGKIGIRHKTHFLSILTQIAIGDVSASRKAELIEILSKLPRVEWNTFGSVCQTFRFRSVSNIRELAQYPAHLRMEQALEIAARTPTRGFIDIENVMVASRISKTRNSLEALKILFSSLVPSPQEAIHAFEGKIQDAINCWGNQNKRQMVLQVIFSPQRPEDFTGPLISNPPIFQDANEIKLGQLVVFVWNLIHMQNPPDNLKGYSKNLEDSLFEALSSSIEEDGNVVCPTGISQRVLSVLQGYFTQVSIDDLEAKVPVNQFLNTLCLGFKDIPSDPNRFYQHAMSQARMYYNIGYPLESFRDHLDEFFYNQEWDIPTY